MAQCCNMIHMHTYYETTCIAIMHIHDILGHRTILRILIYFYPTAASYNFNKYISKGLTTYVAIATELLLIL